MADSFGSDITKNVTNAHEFHQDKTNYELADPWVLDREGKMGTDTFHVQIKARGTLLGTHKLTEHKNHEA